MKIRVDVDGMKIHRDPEGRVSLTDLWKQAGSREAFKPIYYTRSERCAALSAAHLKGEKSSPLEPVVTYRGNGGGTYAVEEIALDYCAWVDPTLALRVQRCFLAASKGDVVGAIKQAAPQVVATEASIDAAKVMLVAEGTVRMLSAIPGVKMDVLGAHALALIEQQTGVPLKSLRLALPSRPVEELPMNPTQLAERLGLGEGRAGAMKMNRVLADAGLQYKDDAGKWHPTQRGERHCDLKPYQNVDNGHTDWQLLWKPSVAQELV